VVGARRDRGRQPHRRAALSRRRRCGPPACWHVLERRAHHAGGLALRCSPPRWWWPARAAAANQNRRSLASARRALTASPVPCESSPCMWWHRPATDTRADPTFASSSPSSTSARHRTRWSARPRRTPNASRSARTATATAVLRWCLACRSPRGGARTGEPGRHRPVRPVRSAGCRRPPRRAGRYHRPTLAHLRTGREGERPRLRPAEIGEHHRTRATVCACGFPGTAIARPGRRAEQLPPGLPAPAVACVRADVEERHEFHAWAVSRSPMSIGRKPIRASNSATACLAPASSPAWKPSSGTPSRTGSLALMARTLLKTLTTRAPDASSTIASDSDPVARTLTSPSRRRGWWGRRGRRRRSPPRFRPAPRPRPRRPPRAPSSRPAVPRRPRCRRTRRSGRRRPSPRGRGSRELTTTRCPASRPGTCQGAPDVARTDDRDSHGFQFLTSDEGCTGSSTSSCSPLSGSW
jgi:hypothetical protein